jgi:amino acid permease
MKAHNEKGEVQIKNIIAVVITVLIALLLVPLVTSSVNDAKNETTGTAAATLIGMIPIFYILAVVMLAVIWVVAESRKMGG